MNEIGKANRIGFSEETKGLLEKHKRRILDLQRDVISSFWKIGEQLIKAKEIIIKETKNRKAPGFVEWVQEDFGFSPSTAARMMRAFKNQLTDPKVIWGNVKRRHRWGDSESTSKNDVVDDNDHDEVEKKASEGWIKFAIEVTTKNSEVIEFLRNLSEMKDTRVGKFVQKKDIKSERCPSCNKVLPDRNRTGFCEQCYRREKRRKAANE